MKGEQNPLTRVMDKAQSILDERWNKMVLEYGQPLFTTDGGKNALLAWPKDPEAVSPEEMQVLVDTRGESAVNQWLAEHYQGIADQEAV